MAKQIFYVSPTGDDNAWGDEKTPFQTIEHAISGAEALRSEQPVEIFVREGTYYLSEPLVFHKDSADNAPFPLSMKAFPGEKPVISGGARLRTEWQQWDEHIYVCDLKGQVPQGFSQLFMNGERQVRSRYPNGHPLRPFLDNFTFIEGADERVSSEGGDKNPTDPPPLPHREVYFSPAMFTDKKWQKPEEAIIHIFPEANWNALQFQLRGIDYDRNAILLGEGGFQQHERWAARTGTDFGITSRYYIENVFEELDAPGEWYYDHEQEKLYFWPPEGCDIQNAVFEVPVLKELIRITGEPKQAASNIRIEGFRFTHTTATFFDTYEVPSVGDWAIVRSGAVFFENAEDCTVENCFFDAVGGNALFASRYNRRLTVKDCLFTESGESAIALVGSPVFSRNGSYNCKFCGEPHPWEFTNYTDEYVGDCFIGNNLIHDIGAFGKQTAGLFMSVAARNTIQHNEVYNVPRAALCIHDGTYGGHQIENNYFHHSCRETDEHGTFNAWGRDSWWCHAQSHQGVSHPAGDVLYDARYTTILRNNRFRDFKGWCIDLDDGASNYEIYNNVCIGAGIKTREGDFRSVHNNIVYLPTVDKPTAIQVGTEDNSDAWYQNVIYAKEDPIHLTKPPDQGKPVKHCDHNCYYSQTGTFQSRDMDFEQWRANNIDTNAVFADPGFRDPENGDFTVERHSPALAVGFQNFPQFNYGPQAFPETWRHLEPDFPVYDYDPVNREILKELRARRKALSPDANNNFVLKPESAERPSQNVYTWRLAYEKTGDFHVDVVYQSPAPVTVNVHLFVESIGTQDLSTSIHEQDEKHSAAIGALSLAGEETDKVELTLTVTPEDVDFALDHLLLR